MKYEYEIYKECGEWCGRAETLDGEWEFGPFPTREEVQARIDACLWRPAVELIKDRLSGRRFPGQWRQKKTHCKRGHSLLDPANIYVAANGYPVCRTCRRDERQKSRRAIFVDNSPELG